MILQPFVSQKLKFFSFLAMMLLVYVHGYNLNNSYLQPFTVVNERLTFTTFFEYLTANGLFRFRIPMLFIISGFLYALNDDKPNRQRIVKRVRTLVIPYLIWSGIALAITFLWQQFPPTAKAVYEAGLDQMGDNRPYAEIDFAGMFARWTLVPVAFQLWFIRVLFVYNLLYPVLKKAVIKIPKYWFPFAGIMWLTMMGLHFIEGEGLLFFTLGIWIAKSGFNVENTPRWLNLKWIVPIFIISSILKTLLAFYMTGGLASFIVLTLLHKTVVFTGLVSMWFGCDVLVRYFMNRGWFVWISAFSFIIYALHVPLINYTAKFILPYIHMVQNYRLLEYLVLPFVVIMFCVAMGAILRKLVPGVYGWMTGGRGF